MKFIFEIVRKRLMVRRVLIIIAHVLLYAAAFAGAFLLRFDFKIPKDQFQHFVLGMGLVVFLRLAAGFVFRLYGGVLKYAGMSDLIDIIKAMSLATAALVVTLVLIGFRNFPRSVIAIDWVASIMAVGGLRFTLRVVREALTPGLDEQDRKRVLIIGAGDAGEALLRDLQRTYRDRYEVVGFVDDNKSKQGLRIHDVPVLGPILYMGDYVPRNRVDEVIIAIPSASSAQMRQIVEVTKIAGVRTKTIPGIDQLIDGTVTVNQVRDVAIEDLLGREPVELEEQLLRKFLFDKVVMVTGAGGSIGAEMCRQICNYLPKKLVLIDQNEPVMFFIHREIKASHPDVPVVPVIADVTDVVRMERVFSDHGPQVIFHAAAHKHVPMMEWNPGEAIKNNVFGTRVVADMANLFGAQAFVMISTDKAVNPTSVMGASKRVSEMYVQALSAGSQTKYTAVRFGNVLGSVGSVVPIFKEQIANGGPVTVTHPDMRRYFMTIPESCQLVMQSAAMGEGGEIFVLDMGEPVKIVDLARDLITLSGFVPDEDIKLEFTGLRPGEKLFEEIGFDNEKMEKTRHAKIYTGKVSPNPLEEVQALLRRLVIVVDETDENVIKAALKAIVPEFETDVEAHLPEGRADIRWTKTPVEALMASARRKKRGSRPSASAKATAGGPSDEDAAGRRADEATAGRRADEEAAGRRADEDAPGRRADEATAGGPADEDAPAAAKAAPEVAAEEVSKGAAEAKPGPLAGEEAPARETAAPVAAVEESSAAKGVPALEVAPAMALEEGPNSLFDDSWALFVEACGAKAFLSAGWNTMGVKPADKREWSAGNGDEIPPEARSVMRRSVPITSLSFIDLWFVYEGKSGKRTPEHVRRAVKDIAHQVTRQLVEISRQVASN